MNNGDGWYDDAVKALEITLNFFIRMWEATLSFFTKILEFLSNFKLAVTAIFIAGIAYVGYVNDWPILEDVGGFIIMITQASLEWVTQ